MNSRHLHPFLCTGTSELLQDAEFSITSNSNCEGMTSTKICADGVENSGACVVSTMCKLVKSSLND